MRTKKLEKVLNYIFENYDIELKKYFIIFFGTEFFLVQKFFGIDFFLVKNFFLVNIFFGTFFFGMDFFYQQINEPL